MKKTPITIALSAKKNHLVFSQTQFDADGFETERKTGILAIESDRDPDEMLELAKTREWSISGEPDQNGFSKVTKVKAAVATETVNNEVEQEA